MTSEERAEKILMKIVSVKMGFDPHGNSEAVKFIVAQIEEAQREASEKWRNEAIALEKRLGSRSRR